MPAYKGTVGNGGKVILGEVAVCSTDDISKSAVYLSLLIFRYMAVFRSRLSCTSASTILEMATSRDGRFCTGRLVMASKEDDIPLSFNSLSCMMVSCKFMLLYICLNVHKCLRASHIVVLWHI